MTASNALKNADLTALRVVRFDAGAVRLEHLFIGVVGAESLAAGEEEIAGEAGLHADDIADAAQLLHAL